MSAGQKRAPDLITDGCEPPCGCRELNSGPLEEQAMLLPTEPSLQPKGSPDAMPYLCGSCRHCENDAWSRAVVAHAVNPSTREAEAGGSL
ncbi:hypothetical protein LEMLEM_LOCUS26501 [Lemmus lemmus]